MLEQDYLMQMIYRLGQAIAHAMLKAGRKTEDDPDDAGEASDVFSEDNGVDTSQEPDPLGAAEMLELSFGECVGMDASILLSLAPESFASMLGVCGVDPQLVPHLVACLELEAEFLAEAGLPERGALRIAQAQALQEAFAL